MQDSKWLEGTYNMDTCLKIRKDKRLDNPLRNTGLKNSSKVGSHLCGYLVMGVALLTVDLVFAFRLHWVTEIAWESGSCLLKVCWGVPACHITELVYFGDPGISVRGRLCWETCASPSLLALLLSDGIWESPPNWSVGFLDCSLWESWLNWWSHLSNYGLHCGANHSDCGGNNHYPQSRLCVILLPFVFPLMLWYYFLKIFFR